MLISVNVNLPDPGSQRRPLPPQLVQFGTEGLVLIELQGALEVEGDKSGQLVGKLRVDPATVSALTSPSSRGMMDEPGAYGDLPRTSRRS